MAAKTVQNQGIDIIAVNFISPFTPCGKSGFSAVEAARQLKIPLNIMMVEKDYLKMLRNPRFGYGRHMNPCIDCRIFMLKRAKKLAKEIGASFIFTGEVLNERPMSQNRRALEIVEEEAGLEGKILRPLSAKLLTETEAEKRGWIDRRKLLGIEGKSRKKQMALAREFGIKDYPCPAGGCLLTCKEFAAKLRDLFKNKIYIGIQDVDLLRVGRHFRFGKNKIVVGRNEVENNQLLHAREKNDYCFEVPDCGSPITLLQGPKKSKAVKMAAALTLRYSDKKDDEALVEFGREKLDNSIIVSTIHDSEIERLRIR